MTRAPQRCAAPIASRMVDTGSSKVMSTASARSMAAAAARTCLWRDGNVVVDVPDDGGLAVVADEAETDRGRDLRARLNAAHVDALAG